MIKGIRKSATAKRAISRTMTAVVLACIIVVGTISSLVALPIGVPQAGATPLGTVLILSTSVSGGSSSAEAAAATADGYSVVVDDETTWESLSESDFASYSAIILGDPACGTDDSAIVAAESDASTWSSAISGNVIVAGNAPVAGSDESNPAGANAFTNDAVAYASAVGAGTTGLYASLSCYYATTTSDTSVPVLADLGSFDVRGGIPCAETTQSVAGSVNVPVQAPLPSFSDLNTESLNWSCSANEVFTSWPSGYSPLELENLAVPSSTSPDTSLIGRPLVLVHTVNDGGSSGFAGAVGGNIPGSATYGGPDPASPGISSGTVAVGTGLNPATGDFVDTATDAVGLNLRA